MSIEQWRSRFEASPADVSDLLEFCRDTNAGVLHTLLTNGQATVEVQNAAGPSVSHGGPGQAVEATTAALGYLPGEPPPARIGLYRERGDQTLLATIPIPLHLEIEAVLDAGLPIEISHSSNEITRTDVVDTEHG